MPDKTPINQLAEELKSLYSALGFVQKFFFPKELGEAIKKMVNGVEVDEIEIKEALANVSSFQRVLFPELGRLNLTQNEYKPIEEKIDALRKGYNSRYRLTRLFFPRTLKKALQKEGNSPLEIMRVLHQDIYFYHRFFFRQLLGRYFRSRTALSSRWLFDTSSIPDTEVGEGFENTLEALEQDWAKKISEPTSNLKDYFKKNPFSRFFMPNTLVDLLLEENPGKTYHIKVTLSVFRLPWYSKFFLSILFPSMMNPFKTNENILNFYKEIEKNTTLPGTPRVERNLRILTSIKNKAMEVNKNKENMIFSETLDCDMTNLISSLNLSGSQSTNINAQRTLDLIASFESTEKDNLDVLHLCDALTLYFKNYDNNDGNTKLRDIVEQFKNKPFLLPLYTDLRQNDIDLFSQTDSATNRNNLDAIIRIRPNIMENAKTSLNALAKHQLLQKECQHRQTNFNTFIQFQKEQGKDLSSFNQAFNHLSDTIAKFSPEALIEQSLFDTFMSSGKGLVVPLMNRFATLFSKMNEREITDSNRPKLYPLFLELLSKLNTENYSELCGALTALDVLIDQEKEEKLNLLTMLEELSRHADPISALKERVSKKRESVTIPLTAARTEAKRTEASNPVELTHGIASSLLNTIPMPSFVASSAAATAFGVYFLYPSLPLSILGGSAALVGYRAAQPYATAAFSQGQAFVRNGTSSAATFFSQGQELIRSSASSINQASHALTAYVQKIKTSLFTRDSILNATVILSTGYLVYQNPSLERLSVAAGWVAPVVASIYQMIPQNASQSTTFPVSDRVQEISEENTRPAPAEAVTTPKRRQIPLTNQMIGSAAIALGVLYMLYEAPSTETLRLGATLLSTHTMEMLSSAGNYVRQFGLFQSGPSEESPTTPSWDSQNQL